MKALATLAACAAILPAVALAAATTTAAPIEGSIACHIVGVGQGPLEFGVKAHTVSLRDPQGPDATITQFDGDNLTARGRDVFYSFEPRNGVGVAVQWPGTVAERVTPLACKFSWL